MQKIIRIIITLAVIVAAVVSGRWVWDHYLYSPWTRDGKVQADIITIAPDVSGWVTKLAVQDNQQVKKGDVIFQVDVKRYQAVVDELQAQVRNETLALELARHEFSRREKLHQSNSISAEELESSRISADMAEASLDLAKANLASAQIDLERASITSPVDGTIVGKVTMYLKARRYSPWSQPTPFMSPAILKKPSYPLFMKARKRRLR